MLIIAGAILLATGLVLTWAPGLLGWFGKLPGDIRIERPSGSVFIPITSSIVASLVLTLVLSLLFRR
jgi:hypothetical protein